MTEQNISYDAKRLIFHISLRDMIIIQLKLTNNITYYIFRVYLMLKQEQKNTLCVNEHARKSVARQTQ